MQGRDRPVNPRRLIEAFSVCGYTNSNELIDFVSGQWKPCSNFTNAQADLGFHFAHIWAAT